MDDFRPRTAIAPIDRSAARPVVPAQAVKPVTASRETGGSDERARPAAQQASGARIEEELASVAEFIEVHARVADILADLDTGGVSVDDAAQALVPKPIVFVPLPPASREAVEHAEAVAKRIVERASYSHSAHAQVSRAAVEQIASS